MNVLVRPASVHLLVRIWIGQTWCRKTLEFRITLAVRFRAQLGSLSLTGIGAKLPRLVVSSFRLEHTSLGVTGSWRAVGRAASALFETS